MVMLVLFTGAAMAQVAPIANVQYVHDAIRGIHGIDVPINPAATPSAAANMKYLLCTVDAANRILNGRDVTDYCNHATATIAAANTAVVNQAVSTHIRIVR